MNNKVISASAGTGKTYRLSLEYLAALLTDKSLLPEDILVMTFTVKATSEIKQRVLEHLKQVSKNSLLQQNLEAICQKRVEKEDLDHLQAMALYLSTHKSRFKIFTLDSFIQNFFYSLMAKNLGLEQTSVTENLGSDKKEDILNQIFAIPALHLFFASSQNKNLNSFSGFVEELLKINLQEHEAKKIDSKQEKEAFGQALQDLRMAVATLSSLPALPASSILLKPYVDFFEQYQGKRCENFSEDFLGTLKDESFFLEAFQSLGDKLWEKLPFKKFKKGAAKEVLESFKESYGEFQLKLKNYFVKTKLFSQHNQILELVEVAQAIYRQNSHQELTFDDFNKILQENLYSQKYFLDENKMLKKEFWQFLEVIPKVLMIDEFQDTSIVQYQNLLPIIKIAERQKGSVIVVGDSKQAIYAWRGGEQGLLSKVGEHLQDCQKLVLDTCYRSSQNVIDFVNHLFCQESGQGWHYNEVKCALAEQGCVELVIDRISKGKNKLEQEIEKVVETKILPLLKEKDLDLSKIAIIARKKKELDSFSQALTKNGIPVYQKRSDSLLSHRAIAPFYLYLKFLGYNDLHSLFLFLKGAPLHLSGEEIAKILSDQELIKNFRLEQNKRLWEDFRKRFDYLSYFDSPDDLANIAAFAEVFERQQQGVVATLQYLHENEKALKQVAGESKQAINLITIHSCKGLEFDTVFYFLNCAGRSGNSLKLHNLVQYNQDFSGVEKSLLTFHFPKLAKSLFEKRLDQENLEILNLAYVALTRAKSNLFIFSNLSLTKVDDPKKELNSWEKVANNMRSFFGEEEVEDSGETYFSARKGSPRLAQASYKKESSVDGWKKESFSAFGKDVNPVKIEPINKENALFGEMVHHYLSYIRWNTAAEKELAQKMTLAKFGKRWQSSFVRLERFLQKNNWLYDKDRWGSVLCEYPLLLEEKEFRLDRVMISKDKKSATIVDYKTGSIENPEQLNIYKKLFQKASGVADVETVFLEIS